eukprot:gene25298-31737_t
MNFELFVKANGGKVLLSGEQDPAEAFVSVGALNNINVEEMLKYCTPSSFISDAEILMMTPRRSIFGGAGNDLCDGSFRGHPAVEVTTPVESEPVTDEKTVFSKAPASELKVPGGHFVAHKDSNALDPDRFLGTLVVCLPSVFAGGDLCLQELTERL